VRFFPHARIIFSRRKNNFAEGSKILQASDTDLKTILLDHQTKFVGILKIMSSTAKNFDILILVPHNYFDSSTKLLFRSVSS